MLAGNWTGLALDFKKCGIVPDTGFERKVRTRARLCLRVMIMITVNEHKYTRRGAKRLVAPSQEFGKMHSSPAAANTTPPT
eukprot:243083-Prorocentrum_minimum.AAC.2